VGEGEDLRGRHVVELLVADGLRHVDDVLQMLGVRGKLLRGGCSCWCAFQVLQICSAVRAKESANKPLYSVGVSGGQR
jgi:hypothetical protein